MTNDNFNNIINRLQYISVPDSIFEDYCTGQFTSDIPFPQCKIIEVSHTPFFAPLPHTPRYFELEGDRALNRTDMVSAGENWRTYWLPLTLEDSWEAILWKADKLVALTGDRHHINLEGFDVIEDILHPSFGS